MIRKKAGVTYAEVLPWHLLERTKEVHENSVSVSQYKEFLHTR
jgi:hypothetical protein